MRDYAKNISRQLVKKPLWKRLFSDYLYETTLILFFLIVYVILIIL
jgi:hypothetical protein